jgi:hypothetical protein
VALVEVEQTLTLIPLVEEIKRLIVQVLIGGGIMKIDPYRSTYVNNRKELNLREELHRTLYGALDEVAKGRVGMLRKMRRDEDGKLVSCACRDQVTEEPDRDYYCKTCLGEGYLWDEQQVVYYKNDEGSEDGSMFFFEYNEDISLIDRIIELDLSDEGDPANPPVRHKIYEIVKVDRLRADNGRIEFLQVTAKYRRDWSVWYGVNPR